MKKKIISTKSAPAAIGPYSQGVVTSGEICFVSGQIPIDPSTGQLVENNIKLQTKQSLENIKAILDKENLSMDNVVKVTVLLKNIEDFTAMNEVYGEYFKEDCPARAAFAVKAIPKDALVEIEAIAVR